MFTGIIEALGKITRVERNQSNIEVWLTSPFIHELKIDQSVAHNGICLTVVEIENNEYRVTAIDETIQKTTLGNWGAGDEINLERCLKVGDRFDGHNVQGHVDTTAICEKVEVLEGSWKFHFSYEPKELSHVTVPKGSIAVNGVSLTVVDSGKHSFSVAIIPFTFEHTQFKHLKAGMKVNIEFDVIGKYVARYAELLKG